VTHHGTRLAGWLLLVDAISALGYSDTSKPPRDVLFRWDTAVSEAALFGLILLVLAAIAWGLPTRETFALRAPASWPAALGLAAIVYFAVIAITAIVNPFLHPGREQGLTSGHWEGAAHAPAFAANLVAFAALGPVVEELTFRGIGYRLLERWGRPAAIVGTGIAFGLWHGLVDALPVLAAFGCLLAWLRTRTGSLLPCIVLHGLFNAIQLVVSVTT
jgi:membrane protease YdiL (CAAX protease family)